MQRFFFTFTHFFFFTIFSLLITTNVVATNYYVSATGNDSADGLTISTPWQSIAKVNSSFSSFLAGSTINFKRGETFYGTINIDNSGTNENPITIIAYGTGNKPVITGFTTITNWTNEGSGIYSKVIPSDSLTNMVTIDGMQVGMGRFPDNEYLKFESFDTNKSISDKDLGTSTNWTGAEIVIRKNDWTIDRCLVTNHTADVLSYKNLASNQEPKANFGYFFMNDLRTLTSFGEWYHNPATGKFYMYFGSVNPNTKVVRVATLNNLIYNKAHAYIRLENLKLTGSIDNAVEFLGGNDYCSVHNCDISFAGNSGIDFRAGSRACMLDNNTIRYCNNCGIDNNSSASQTTNNTISYIGRILGQSKAAVGLNGIYMTGNGGVISYNTISKIGYCGIIVKYRGTSTVSYNRIDSVCLLLNDGGGIYTCKPSADVRIIDHNIITNAIGNNAGTPGTHSMAEGIYLDEYTSNAVVTNNTVSNIGNSGIKLHKAHDNTITDNTIFNCGAGVDFQNSSVMADYIHGISFRRNVIVSKTASQNSIYFHTTNNDDITLFGIADSNYYARPIDNNPTFKVKQPAIGTIEKSLTAWHAFSKQDAHSKKYFVAVKNVNDIRFEVNPTKIMKTIMLEGTYMGVENKIYKGTIKLQPFSSIVLMKYHETALESR